MVELTMASFLSYLLPTIQYNHSNKIFNFHATSLAQPLLDTQPETRLTQLTGRGTESLNKQNGIIAALRLSVMLVRMRYYKT